MTDTLEEEVEALRERVLALETALYDELDVRLGPKYGPRQRPQMTECDDCGIMFAVDVSNGLKCPWCGTLQSDHTEANA